jgi:hypothetical protein
MRPFFAFPVLALGLLIAFAFFKLYGPATRPDVPLQVSATVEHYAPGTGIKIGDEVRASKAKLQAVRWVRHVGFIGGLSAGDFTQARLYVAPRDRDRATGMDNARIDAVELVSIDGEHMVTVMSDVAIAFRGIPKDGCIVPEAEGMPHRRVQFWTTPKNRGGVAILSEWTTKDRPRNTPSAGVAVWSLYAWAGPFEGSKTLRARFDPHNCMQVAGI